MALYSGSFTATLFQVQVELQLLRCHDYRLMTPWSSSQHGATISMDVSLREGCTATAARRPAASEQLQPSPIQRQQRQAACRLPTDLRVTQVLESTTLTTCPDSSPPQQCCCTVFENSYSTPQVNVASLVRCASTTWFTTLRGFCWSPHYCCRRCRWI